MSARADTYIRTATAADLSAIAEIQLASAEAPQWTSVQIAEALQTAHPESSLQRRVFVAEHAGTVCGFAVASVLASIQPPEAELESIAVLPQHRRQGIGRALLQAVLAWAAVSGAEILRLEVRAGNAAAIAAYRSAGFRNVGLRRRYYSHPLEDAVVMHIVIPRNGQAIAAAGVA